MTTGLYVHFPFCVRKCLYCDFNSDVSTMVEREEYPGLILAEMKLRKRQLAEPLRAATLYFGGGTPSLMPPAEVGRLIDAAAAYFGLTADAEITLEANPGTVTPEKLAGYRAAGVNRISLGIQSFEDRLLVRLGRVHSKREALAAFDAVRRGGFDNVSIDLMHSLPGQTPSQWREALLQGIALSPEHISAYALSVEEGTPLAALKDAGRLPLPDEDEAAAMFEATAELLEEGGYRHYEISSFARPGFSSRHNGIYWSRDSYLGFGAGAHSLLNRDGLGERWLNVEEPAQYREAIRAGRIPQRDHESLTVEDAVAESFFLGLRVLSGLDLGRLKKLYGEAALATRLAEVEKLVQGGALIREGDTVRLAPSAVILANPIFARFI